MSNVIKNKYIIIGTFRGFNHDVILGYFDTLEEAEQYNQRLENYKITGYADSIYGQIEETSINQLKGEFK